MADTKAHLNGQEKTESRDKRQPKPPRWVLTQYTALVAAVYTDETGTREARYTLNTMDPTSKRIVPTLLGVGQNPCPHRSCQVLMAGQLMSEQDEIQGDAPPADDSHWAVGSTELPLL